MILLYGNEYFKIAMMNYPRATGEEYVSGSLLAYQMIWLNLEWCSICRKDEIKLPLYLI